MKYKLKDIFDLQMGKTPSRNNIEYWNTKDFKWISISDLTKAHGYISETKEYISERAVSESGIKIIPANTVVMSFKLSIGKTAITSEDMYSNEAIMAFHDKHVVEILPEYIFYIFKYKKWDEDSNNAVMGKTLNKAILSEAEIEICSIEEQRVIVDILDNMMSVLESRGTELDLLDNLIKARFVEMFENEIEYNKVKLEEIADIVSGITKGRKTKCGELREVPYMAVSNVKDGYIDWTTVKTILATEDEIIQYKLLPDDVLMTEGGDPDKLGRGAIISLPPKDCIHQNHIFRVRLDETQILPRYFAAYLQSSQAKTYFLRAAKQTTGIASINMSQLRGLPTIVPPIELQLKYSLFSEQVDKSKLLSLIKLLEQLITYLYNIFIIYRQDKGEEVEDHE